MGEDPEHAMWDTSTLGAIIDIGLALTHVQKALAAIVEGRISDEARDDDAVTALRHLNETVEDLQSRTGKLIEIATQKRGGDQ